MIVTLSGVTGTGKSFFKNTISEELCFKNLVIVTTREKRIGEVNGIDKEFVSEEEFEKLKKEMWYLNKVVIPKLKQNIEDLPSLDLSDIQNSLTNLEKSLTTLQSNIDKNNQSISNNTTNISQIQKDIDDIISNYSNLMAAHNGLAIHVNGLENEHNEFSNKISSIEANISQITNSISTISSISNQNVSDISTLKTDVSEIKTSNSNITSSIENLNTRITTLENNDISFTDDIDVLSYNYSNLLNSHNGLAFHVDDLEAEHEQFVNDISSLNENNTLLSNSLTNVSSISNQNSNEIETIKQDIQLIKSQLENLSGGSGLDYDVLYDMRSDDAAINHGVTSGAVGGTTLMIDLTPYRYLRVFGYVNSYECQDFIKLTDRNRTDFTMMSIATNMKTLNFLKYAIPATMDRIQFSNFATYTYNSAKLSFGSYELGKTNENFYAYRIEGIK